MNRALKSICYAFVAQDIEVYIPDDKDDCFLACHLVCSNCQSFWYTSMIECYFCGELNYYLYSCTSCGKMYSITNSGIQCDCGSADSKLVKKCINDNCLSNTDSEVSDIAIRKKGVFELNSSFNLSLMRCVICGDGRNYYKTYQIYLIETDQIQKEIDAVISVKKIETGSVIIYKKHEGSSILYDYQIYNPEEQYNPKFIYKSIESIVDQLYPQKE